MPENLFETRYDLTKKAKFKELYESNKILIYSTIIILVTIISFYSYYQYAKEKKKIFLSIDESSKEIIPLEPISAIF